MKYIIITFILTFKLFGSYLETTIKTVDHDSATIKAKDGIKVGMSGFVVHQLSNDHSTIIRSAVVSDINTTNNSATIQLKKFTMFINNNLPSFKIKPAPNDIVILAFGYNRGLLIAPNEKIYYRLKNAMRSEVLAHPDIFATYLSSIGHPSPQKEDFSTFCQNLSIGLLFFYLEQKLYTVDCQSFSIIDTQQAPLEQNSTQVPFYSRVKKIEANWFGKGSSKIENYEQYYYNLLLHSNTNNATKLQ